jgi:hypothetical protein
MRSEVKIVVARKTIPAVAPIRSPESFSLRRRNLPVLAVPLARARTGIALAGDAIVVVIQMGRVAARLVVAEPALCLLLGVEVRAVLPIDGMGRRR